MKHIIPLFTVTFALHLAATASVPLTWTVETTRAQPATFEAYQGETLDFEAALQSRGKPLEAPLNYSFFWQTNGMGRYYWEVKVRGEGEQRNDSTVHLDPSPSPTNVLFATWLPAYDVGAKVYNCFIGSPSNNYHAAFQLRLRPSPGATPNALPLPTPVIDFAKVRVLNPPWSGGGTDTNAVRDIIHATVDGASRPLPKYLHIYETNDSYPAEAEEYYRSRGNGKVDGGCSSVRDGGFLYRNFDYPFDDRAEFVVRMSAGRGRFASVGVAQAGTNLTEAIVTSGKPEFSARYKWLPGATVDGINENGVVCEINVVDGTPPRRLGGDIHPLAAVRWALDNAKTAEDAATNLAARIQFPAGWEQNFHWMIADATETWIVENGTASNVTAVAAKRVMTNFPILPDTYAGTGKERYQLLFSGEPITNAWFTRAYRRDTNWASDFKDAAEMEAAKSAWETHDREYLRGKGLWQSVHTSIYDLTNRTLRVAVQETDDWYVFALAKNGTDEAKVREIAAEVVAPVASSVSTLTSSVSGLQSSKADKSEIEWIITWSQRISDEVSSKADQSDIDETVIPAIGDAYSLANSAKQKADAIEQIAMDASQKAYTALDQLQDKADSDDLDQHVEDSNVHVNLTEKETWNAKADAADIPTTPQQVGAYPAASGQQLAGQVATIGAHLNAEDARFVSTNYNSATRMPEAYVEIKLPDQTWSVVWREMTRWNWFFDTWVPENLYTRQQVDALLLQKADRSWGFYDSHSGTYAPDGYTWISSPKVALAAGLGYQRTVTTEGSVWVLESNGLVTETGGVSSNGFFRISDDEGNVHFEIVKGNRRTIGADSSSCQVVAAFSPTKLRIGYSVVSDAHPTLRICNDLTTKQWKDETDPDCLATVTWDGSSGAWVAYVQGKAAQSLLFVKATYETGAESYIRNVAPVSMDYMYLGGVKYAVGTATISGHTVLTLTPAP